MAIVWLRTSLNVTVAPPRAGSLHGVHLLLPIIPEHQRRLHARRFSTKRGDYHLDQWPWMCYHRLSFCIDGQEHGGIVSKEWIRQGEAGGSVSEHGWLLETRGLTKRFGGLVAVDSLPLALRPGEVRGLIGPNGSGKTTTINLLSGLYRADAGAIYLRGERIDRLRPHEITARGVVRTFQLPKLFGNMTVFENVLIPALAALDRGAGRPLPESHERARQLLAFVTLDRLRHALAKELSGGQAMLLQIARGLMVQPSHLFLLDEPFAGVHPTVKDTIMAAILRMNQEEGMTFLIVSHEMTTLRRLCPRVSVMHEGRLIAEGSFEEVANHSSVLEAYLGG